MRGADPRSAEYIRHYVDQIARLPCSSGSALTSHPHHEEGAMTGPATCSQPSLRSGAEPGRQCQAAIATQGRCLAHLPQDALERYLRGAIYVNAARVVFTPVLLERVLTILTDHRSIGARHLNLPGAEFTSRLEFRHERLSCRADFSGATFANSVDFCGTHFESVDFSGATFGEHADFRGAELDGANFGSVTFGGWSDFRETTFGNGVDFAWARFMGGASFSKAKFSCGTANFRYSAFGRSAHFEKAIFEEEADFSGVDFKDIAWFDEVVFDADTTFSSAMFSDDTRFRGVHFSGESDFRLATFQETIDARLGEGQDPQRVFAGADGSDWIRILLTGYF